MKKLEIFKKDEVITLVSDYAMIPDDAAHELNTAEDDMYVTIRFGTSAITIKKGDFQFMVESEVKDA